MKALVLAALLAWTLDHAARRLWAAWWGRRVVADLAADLAAMTPRGPQT